ncbi:S41 family peptidase [Polaribacter sp. MSW13]|uniref:S41 family peptidase n=1 Tax=Polaribacter marinus TaxID=2916838 RepID=A0A9X1VLX0_9FLAO|nr:S41 family peptidase [Polaribacter marinus]MCI2228485.1 S41 family peptidase [Polaribacter marinus]
MKRIIQFSLLLIVILLNSCEDKKFSHFEPTINDDINYFIWKGLNAYYLWQKDVPDLADNRFADFDELYTHYSGFSSPESVFNSLLNQPGTIDKYSWIVDDYIALENSFQGINLSNGMEFGLVKYTNGSSNVFGYVRYVIPNSDAFRKGITRGMIFNIVDGTQLTLSNYKNLLFNNNTNYSIELADYNNGNPIGNNNTISLDKTQLQENPIAISKIINDGNKKIGYLMYNQFSSSFDAELNAVFNNFKSENINELIIDLRYNGGGSVRTATYLGSMITGQYNDDTFSKQVWNRKVQEASDPSSFINKFTNKINNGLVNETINSLGLTKIYFIVTGSSASASELVINSLSSYIDVRLVGTKTVGKQVGSITIYDSDNLKRNGNNLNPNHNYAMQPLVLEISNKDNQNHPEGFTPGVTLPGIVFAENYNNLGVLGERSDPLLNRTLTYISTNARMNNIKEQEVISKEIYSSKLAMPTSNNMYIELKEDL